MKVINDIGGEHVYMSDSLSNSIDTEDVTTHKEHLPTAVLDLADGPLFALFKRVIALNESSTSVMKSLSIVIDVKELKRIMSSDIKKVKLTTSDVDIMVEETAGLAFEVDFVPIDQQLIDLVISFKR